MAGDKSYISPIMTNSESIRQFGNNGYAKPAAALNILRETIMGRDLFDYAFKTYCERWAFKHPTPADLFRTLEDASGVDLDWFWRGWFYTTDHVDLAINKVNWYKMDTKDPLVEKNRLKKEREQDRENITVIRNRQEIEKTYDEIDPSVRDFYSEYDPLEITEADKQEYDRYFNSLSKKEQELLVSGKNFYELEIESIGGLVSPIILEFEFVDGSKQVERIPAEIWRMGDVNIKKVFMTDKEIKQITLDPFLETADTDTSNNFYPKKEEPNRFELYKQRNFMGIQPNPMQKSKKKSGA